MCTHAYVYMIICVCRGVWMWKCRNARAYIYEDEV